LGVIDSCPNGLGESDEEMAGRSWELITTDESAVVAITYLDTLVVKYGKSNGCFPDPPWAEESEGSKVFSETNDLFDQSLTSKTGSGRRRRSFALGNCQSSLVDEINTTVAYNLAASGRHQIGVHASYHWMSVRSKLGLKREQSAVTKSKRINARQTLGEKG
jgi:hypothetical protein